MQGDPVHRCGHTVFADTVVDVIAREVRAANRTHRAGAGVVRAGQVGRTANRVGQGGIDHFQSHFRGLTGCHFGRGGGLRGLEVGDGLRKCLLVGFFMRCIESGGFGGDRFAGGPSRVVFCAARGNTAPSGGDIGGHFERRVWPIQSDARSGDFLGPQWRAVHLVATGFVRRALADDCAGGDK